MPTILGISLLIYIIIGETIPESILLTNPLLILPVFLIAFFFQGAISKEFGWRGFALDRLQEKYNALTSSIIIGIVWGFWHLPLFYINGTSQSKMPVVLIIFFILNSVFLSILFTWLHNNTGGNILVALLFHTMVNLTYGLIQLTTTYIGFLIVVSVTLIVDIVIVIIWYPQKMIRIKKLASS